MAVVFSILSDIPRERLLPHASDLSIGLSQIFKLGTKWLSVSSNRAVWHSAVSLLQLTAAVPSAVGFSFEATSLLLTEESVTAENYGECVDLLLAYPASLASSSSSLSGSQNAASRKGKGDRGDESRYVSFGCREYCV